MQLKSLATFLLSSNFSTLPTSLKWRTQIQHRRLLSQISSLLLQRKKGIPLLLRTNLPSSLSENPNLFYQILARTQFHPDISLHFFHWVQKALSFQPDLKSQCKMVQILGDSGRQGPAKELLGPLLRLQPASAVLDLMGREVRWNPQSRVLDLVLEEYCELGTVSGGLETFGLIRACGCVPGTVSCNALLGLLMRSSGGTGVVRCVFAAAVRSRTVPDSNTWSLLAKVLCKEGKLEKAVVLANSGLCSANVFDELVDCYCRKGDFFSAISLLNCMHDKNLRPGFSTYSSILDAGCKFGIVGIVNSILKEMVVRELLPTAPFCGYDWIIVKLSELERTHAAEAFLDRAQDGKFTVGDVSYLHMLKAMSKNGRGEEAMKVYRILLDKRIAVDSGCCDVFVKGICNGDASEEANVVLMDFISRGFLPGAADVSKYVSAQFSICMWKEAAELLNFLLEKGILPDASCCCSLVEHYCNNGRVDYALDFHDKMKKLGGSLDASSYNLLLRSLFKRRRVEEAMQLFGYMRRQKVLDSSSFSVMISALCREKELKRAMELHDEMLKVGLKPDQTTYRRLISGFK